MDFHCSYDSVHDSGDHCFDFGYVGKQPVAWDEYCTKYWLQKIQESMYRCTSPII